MFNPKNNKVATDVSGQAGGRGRCRPRNARRGQSMVEFALCFLLFMAVVLGFGQIGMSIWIKTTLHHAVREGVRYAITGATQPGLGHDASIRDIVIRNSAGLIEAATADSLVHIDLFDQDGAPTGSNAGGNTVVVAVEEYPIPVLAPEAVSWVASGLKVTVSAVDRLEPFPTPPSR